MDVVLSAALSRLTELVNEEGYVRKLDGIVKGVQNESRTELNRRWKGVGWKCMFPGCQDPVIRSHSLQKGGSLAVLAEGGSKPNSSLIVTPEWSPHSERHLNRRDISIGDASTFPGFCHAHDNTLFRTLEAPGITLDLETRLSQSYRTFCRELRLHGHINMTTEAGFDGEREAERRHMVETLIDLIPAEYRHLYPDLRNLKFRLNDHRRDEFRTTLAAQKKFLCSFDELSATFDRYIVDPRMRPSIAARFFTIEGTLPYALSGSDDISKIPYSPIPIFYFVMPLGAVTEVGFFTATSHERMLDDLLQKKGVSGLPIGGQATALRNLCEQLLFDRTDHWFMRPSTWNGLPEAIRDELIPLGWQSGKTIWRAARPTVFPHLDNLTLRQREHFVGS